MGTYLAGKEEELSSNTKSVQTDVISRKTRSFGTQTKVVIHKDFTAYFSPETKEGFTMTDENQCECGSEEYDDSSLVSEIDSESSISPIKEKRSTRHDHIYKSTSKPALAYIIFWSALESLLKYCLTCGAKANIVELCHKGSALIVDLVCIESHKNVWRSQPLNNWYHRGNIILVASVLFSSNTFAKIAKYFSLANIPWVSESRFYALQRNHFFGVANEAWVSEQNRLLAEDSSTSGKNLSGDGRCDSPGYNAKYLTYSMLDQATGKILAMSVTQCTETGNSNRMEKTGFIKVVNEIENRNVKIKQMTTDRHIQIKKYMKEETRYMSSI